MFLQLNQGNRTSFNRIRENEDAETAPNSEIDSSFSSSFPPNSYQISQTTDTTSLNSAQASEYEDAESGAFVFMCSIILIMVSVNLVKSGKFHRAPCLTYS